MTVAEKVRLPLTVPLSTQPVLCERCEQQLARYDGAQIVVQRPKQDVYVVIPGNRAVIQCPHYRRVNGQWSACGYLNHIFLT